MIKRLASRVCILLVIGSWWGVSSASTYSINRTVDGGTVSGTITTDGTIGELLLASITDWDFDITIGAFMTTFDPSNSDFNVIGINGSGFTATAGDLIFNADSTDDKAFGFQQDTDPFASWALCSVGATGTGNPCTTSIGTEWLYDGVEFNEPIVIERTGEINVGVETAVVPIPAAVWLFGSGLLGLVGMARRKKAA